MADYRAVYVQPVTHRDLVALSERDQRPIWKVISDALAIYHHLYKDQRDPPKGLKSVGRPKKVRPGDKPAPIKLLPPDI